MHLSNILDYHNVVDGVNILYTLTQHMNLGGIICFEAILSDTYQMHKIYNQLNILCEKHNNQTWKFCRKAPMLYIIQRVK